MFYNIMEAAAEAAFNVDRRRLQQPVRAVALAEDARGGFELLKVRYVMADWSVHCRMLDLATAEKAALDKARSLPDTLASFLPEEALRNAFKDKIRIFMADGEFSEPLAARLSKVQGTLPGLKAIMRCSVHSGQRSLEKALSSDPDVQGLLQSWVLGFSDGSGKNPGGFCRAVRNSLKLQRLTAEKQLEGVDESLRRLCHFGFAPQRFNTVCDACVNVAENIDAVCNVLSHLAAVDDALSGWATKLLQQCFQPEKKFNHSLDGQHLRLAATAHNLQQLERLINRLFDFRSPAGELQQPLVLDDAYAHGYVQRLQATLKLEQNKCLVVKQKMIFWHSGANRNKIRSFVAKELGAIRNIAQLFVQGLKADVEVGVQASLSPFDVNHTLCSDEALPEPDIFKPLAEAAQVEVTQLAKEFLLARPTALLVKSQPPGDKTGGEDLNEIWSRTMRHWSDKLPALSEAAALVLSCFPSTGEIEQNFSWLQQFSEGSLMKVRLDGPTADQLVCREPHSILPRKPCLKLLQEYRRLFAPSGGSQGCRSSLGRRVLNGRLNPLSRAGLKRQRGLEQQQLLQQAPAESQPEDLATLEAEAGESAKRRRTDKQVSLTAALEKYKTKKEEWATLDASSEAAAAGRLIEKEREAEKRFEKLKKIGVARLSAVRSDVLAADRDRLIMVVHGHDSSKTPGLPDLERLGNARAWPESIEDQRNLVYDLLRHTSEDCGSHRLLYWVCLSDEVERDFIFKPSESAFSAVARHLGGGFCGRQWVQACMDEGRLLPALTCLKSSLTTKQELCLHSSCMSDDSALPATRMLGAVLDAAERADITIAWTRRKRWRDVTCKKCSVIVDGETAEKYRKKKQRHFHTAIECLNGTKDDVWLASTAMPPSRTAAVVLCLHGLIAGAGVSLDCNFPFVQQTIGFDTVTRTLSAFIGTIGNLVKTSRNMWIFVRTMGDAWSHVAVQIALQTHVHMVLLSGSQLLGQYLVNIVSCLCDLIVKRHDAGEDYGIIMLPVGFVNDILELRILFSELMEVMSKDHYEQSWESIPKIAARLKPATAALFDVIPRDVQFEICFGGRERYMNKIDFSTISTDRLLLRFVEMELLRRRQLGHISKDSHEALTLDV
ncbi:PFP-BETA1 [Symbiodinium sp. CCMP2592]|nr:PFP-BETA1 [Symbiodinium sp. CCMP2592]